MLPAGVVRSRRWFSLGSGLLQAGGSLSVVVRDRLVLFAPGGGSLSPMVRYRPVVLSRWWFATGRVVHSRRWFSRRWFALGGDITDISWTFPHTPIRPTGNGPLPHTSSARNWFIGVMARAHSGTRAADINPEISARPPLPFFTNSRRKRWTGCCGSWPSRQPGEGICSDAASWDKRVLSMT